MWVGGGLSSVGWAEESRAVGPDIGTLAHLAHYRSAAFSATTTDLISSPIACLAYFRLVSLPDDSTAPSSFEVENALLHQFVQVPRGRSCWATRTLLVIGREKCQGLRQAPPLRKHFSRRPWSTMAVQTIPGRREAMAEAGPFLGGGGEEAPEGWLTTQRIIQAGCSPELCDILHLVGKVSPGSRRRQWLSIRSAGDGVSGGVGGCATKSLSKARAARVLQVRICACIS